MLVTELNLIVDFKNILQFEEQEISQLFNLIVIPQITKYFQI